MQTFGGWLQRQSLATLDLDHAPRFGKLSRFLTHRDGSKSNECGKIRDMLSLRVTLCASASVFALVLMASMALARDASTDASVEEDFPMPCDGYPVFIDGETLQDAVPEQIKSDCAEGGCPEPAEDLPVAVSDDLAELDPIIYQNAAAVVPAVAWASSERSVESADDIPNFCDIAGPGWNWLCAVN